MGCATRGIEMRETKRLAILGASLVAGCSSFGTADEALPSDGGDFPSDTGTADDGGKDHRETDGAAAKIAPDPPLDVVAVSVPVVTTVTTLAGSRAAGAADGIGTAATFNLPHDVAVDSAGNVFVADANSYRIRMVTPEGVVTTIAGSPAGTSGFANGKGKDALFNYPTGIAVDDSGILYVADSRNHRIRKILPDGTVSTLAGSGDPSFADATGVLARFNEPFDVALDKDGDLYVADSKNHRIRKVTAAGSVTTVAGSGAEVPFVDGMSTSATFSLPLYVAVEGSGDIFIGDSKNNRVRKATTAGAVTTLAGAAPAAYVDAVGVAARFSKVAGMATDEMGNVYIADFDNHRIRRATRGGVVTTLAGTGESKFVDGDGRKIGFSNPSLRR